jgi:uncharacterized membrane protein
MNTHYIFGLGQMDILALCFFIWIWVMYAWLIDHLKGGKETVSKRMVTYRSLWMKEMAGREVRILDTQINQSLQNGTAFFASTSLFAIGGALTLLGATDKVFELISDLPLAFRPSRVAWEVKCFGLVIIFVYAFFKFAWAYRLFNYCSILIGATPDNQKMSEPNEAMLKMAERAAKMNAFAGHNFNRGQRAFFFALGYFGWFINPYFFILSTILVTLVLWLRQYKSPALVILE